MIRRIILLSLALTSAFPLPEDGSTRRAGDQEVPSQAYVAVADALARELTPSQAVCVRPQLLSPGDPGMPNEIRRALEERGWTFYDEPLPADTGAVLLVFSEAGFSDGSIRLFAGFSGKYLSRGRTGVHIWTSTWRFDVRCPANECSVQDMVRWKEMDGSLHEPEEFLAGEVGRCAGKAPGG